MINGNFKLGIQKKEATFSMYDKSIINVIVYQFKTSAFYIFIIMIVPSSYNSYAKTKSEIYVFKIIT